MNPATNRYEDRHVREDASLADVAEAYVQAYAGDFIFLRDCRDRLAAGMTLTVAQVRSVLNCMRSDPRAGVLPVPDRPADVISIADRRRRRPTARPRPRYVDLPVRWRLTHGASTHRAARTVHAVARTSGIRYYPQVTQDSFEDRFQCRVRWVCTPSHLLRQYELLGPDDAERLATLPGWQHCRRCAARPEHWVVRLYEENEL